MNTRSCFSSKACWLFTAYCLPFTACCLHCFPVFPAYRNRFFPLAFTLPFNLLYRIFQGLKKPACSPKSKNEAWKNPYLFGTFKKAFALSPKSFPQFPKSLWVFLFFHGFLQKLSFLFSKEDYAKTGIFSLFHNNFHFSTLGKFSTVENFGFVENPAFFLFPAFCLLGIPAVSAAFLPPPCIFTVDLPAFPFYRFVFCSFLLYVL